MDSREVLRVSNSAVFGLLIGPRDQRPWSVRELVLELGNQLDVEDAVACLHGAGLLHRCGEFVWATRTALAADQLTM